MIDPTRRQLITSLPAAATAVSVPVVAQAISGPIYAGTYAGLAGTTPGQAFTVDNGDGTVTIYLNRDRSALAQFTITTTAELVSQRGSARVGHAPEGAGAVTRPIGAVIDDLGHNLKSFGVGVGTGSPSIDTAAWRAALASLASTGTRRLIVPAGEYLIEDTIEAPAGLGYVEIVGMGGYDGHRGPINHSHFTSLKWAGSTDAAKAVVKLDRANGLVWRGISINCDHKAGYGLQFYSSTTSDPSAKNIVERCSIHYALRDGIIVGAEGVPAPPASRQFFGYRFADLTFVGCGYAGIHINEWNADQLIFDSVMGYGDDSASPQNSRYGIWFERGGQASLIDNCQWHFYNALVPAEDGAGYAIFNKQTGSTTGGAFGLDVRNFWHEGGRGLYYGVTSTNDEKCNKFTRCISTVDDDPDTYPVVYIDKGTPTQIPHTFDTCTFRGDIKINSPTFDRDRLRLINCNFGSTGAGPTQRGVIWSDGVRSLDGTGGSPPRRACMAKKSVDQTNADYSGAPVISWDAEIYDDEGFHNNVTNDSRFTVPAGVTCVEIGCSLRLSNVDDVIYVLEAMKNGSASFDGACAVSGKATDNSSPEINIRSGPIPVTAGDYFEWLLYCPDATITVVAARSNAWMRVVA